MLSYTDDTDDVVKNSPLHYICRYRLIAVGRKEVNLEPVLEEERKALQLSKTPIKNYETPPTKTPKTPSSLVKIMGRLSISDKNSSIIKNNSTKLLLKRAIPTDKNEKASPKTTTPKSTFTTRKYAQKIDPKNLEEVLLQVLQEDSDEELPTVIRQQVPSTSTKRKMHIKIDETPKKVLVLEQDEEETQSSTLEDDEEETQSSSLEDNEEETQSSSLEDNEEETQSSSLEDNEEETQSSSLEDNEEETQYSSLEDNEEETQSPSISRRVIRKPIYHEKISPVKLTPTRAPKNSPKTPKTTKSPKTPKTPKTRRTSRGRNSIMKTPESVSRRIRTSDLTPTLHSRAHSVDNTNDFYKENKSLPSREKQLDEILSFVKSKFLNGVSGCMYISGVPGTGKTATVKSALQILKEDQDLPEFKVVEVNGMWIAEPRQAFVQIYKQLTGKSVVWEQAVSLLQKRFTKPGPRRTPTILIVDELDALCNRRQDVIYSIMEWANHKTALLTVLAVANTMDLPERALGSRVASRMGLTRLAFPPYTQTQLECIVTSRLASLNVTPDAVQLIARKVAVAVSGNVRRALALCSRALELGGSGGAGLDEVQRALTEARCSANVRAIRNCSPAEKLILRAVAAEVEQTGSDETTLSRVLQTAGVLVALDGRPYRSAPNIRPPTPSQTLAICARLAATRLLLMEPKTPEPKILLNVSPDDVYYGTKQITVI